MAPFDLDATLDRDYQLINSGPVVLFHRKAVLADTVTWLDERGYLVHRLDAAAWTSQADFHRDVHAALDFPDHYGGNLDAFTDCLHDVATFGYGSSRDATGTVLVFTGYDAFAGREPRAAWAVLDVIAGVARFAMLFGHRMMCLVQSNDPDIRFEPVGAAAVGWHR